MKEEQVAEKTAKGIDAAAHTWEGAMAQICKDRRNDYKTLICCHF